MPSANDPIWYQHQRAIEVRNAELTAHWNRYNIQMVINTGVIYAFATAPKDTIDKYAVLWVPFGAFLCLLWNAINDRGHRWIGFWNRWIRTFEADAGFRPVFVEAWQDTRKTSFPVVVLSSLVTLAFSAIWLILATVFLSGFNLASVVLTSLFFAFSICITVHAADRTRKE